MNEKQAIEMLTALLGVPGALKIITNAHCCQEAIHPSFAGFETDQCRAYGETLNSRALFGENYLADPRHFVWHDVVEIEGPDEKGIYQAFSANREDMTMGYPVALLGRLTEVSRFLMRLEMRLETADGESVETTDGH